MYTKQTISLALSLLVFGRGNMIDKIFMDSYPACCGDQFGGKNVKNGLSVAQIWQNAKGDRSLTLGETHHQYSKQRAGVTRWISNTDNCWGTC